MLRGIMILKKYIINNEVIFDVNLNELVSLLKSGESVLLNIPTARCLLLLLENIGQVVSREEFLEKVWNERGIVVSHNTFYQNISLLRKSLAKAGLSEEAVVTIRQRGFTLASDIIVSPVVVDNTPPCNNDDMNVVNRVESAVELLPIPPSKENNTKYSDANKKFFEVPTWLLLTIIVILGIDIFLMIFIHLF